MTSRGAIGDAKEGVANGIQAALQSGEENVVSEVLGLVGHTTVATGNPYESLADRSEIRHRRGLYHAGDSRRDARRSWR